MIKVETGCFQREGPGLIHKQLSDSKYWVYSVEHLIIAAIYFP